MTPRTKILLGITCIGAGGLVLSLGTLTNTHVLVSNAQAPLPKMAVEHQPPASRTEVSWLHETYHHEHHNGKHDGPHI